MYRNILILFFTILVGLINPSIALPAELLQVTSSDTILIGDNNRNYKVKIACINIYPFKDKEATEWLKSQFPRYSKVNLHPKGSFNGQLIAELINIKTNKDISESMIELGFGDYNC